MEEKCKMLNDGFAYLTFNEMEYTTLELEMLGYGKTETGICGGMELGDPTKSVAFLGDDAIPQVFLLLSHIAFSAKQFLGIPDLHRHPRPTSTRKSRHRILKKSNFGGFDSRPVESRRQPTLFEDAQDALSFRRNNCSSIVAKDSSSYLERRLQQACASVSLRSDAATVRTDLDRSPVEETAETDENVGNAAVDAKNFDKYRIAQETRALMKNLSALERAGIGAGAGGIAGAFTYACLHPLDTVKTRLQTRGASEVYASSVDVAMKILQTKGIAGFYSGISAVIVGSTISSAIYFGTCEFGKSLLSKIPKFPSLLIPPVAGAMGNIVSSAILVPKEVITQRMQAGAKGRSWNVLVRTLEKDGIKGLYVGYSAALLRNLPAGVISFSTFEYLRAAWLRTTLKDSLEPWQSVTSGALAGAIAAGLTTPLDVVKTRLMTQGRAGATAAAMDAATRAKVAALTYKGVASTLHRIWVEEGWVGLTRGIGPRLLHSACFSAIGFFAFETARVTILKQHIARKQEKLRALENPS